MKLLSYILGVVKDSTGEMFMIGLREIEVACWAVVAVLLFLNLLDHRISVERVRQIRAHNIRLIRKNRQLALLNQQLKWLHIRPLKRSLRLLTKVRATNIRVIRENRQLEAELKDRGHEGIYFEREIERLRAQPSELEALRLEDEKALRVAEACHDIVAPALVRAVERSKRELSPGAGQAPSASVVALEHQTEPLPTHTSSTLSN